MLERPEASRRSSVRLRYSPQLKNDKSTVLGIRTHLKALSPTPYYSTHQVAFYTYILRSLLNGRYYVGSCENLEQRRNSSTKNGIPWELKKVETFSSRKEAFQREQY